MSYSAKAIQAGFRIGQIRIHHPAFKDALTGVGRIIQLGNALEHPTGACIIAPSGEIIARCTTKGDELAFARCDLDLCNSYKRTTFNFDIHRQPRAYGMIVERKGVATMADGAPVAPKR